VRRSIPTPSILAVSARAAQRAEVDQDLDAKERPEPRDRPELFARGQRLAELALRPAEIAEQPGDHPDRHLRDDRAAPVPRLHEARARRLGRAQARPQVPVGPRLVVREGALQPPARDGIPLRDRLRHLAHPPDQRVGEPELAQLGGVKAPGRERERRRADPLRGELDRLQRAHRRHELVEPAEVDVRGDLRGHRPHPGHAPGRQEALRLVEVQAGVVPLAAPRVDLREHAQQAQVDRVRRAALEPPPGARDRRVLIAPPERLLGGAQVEAPGAREVQPALEVLGEHRGIARAALLQEGGGEPVPEDAIRLREHLVGPLPQERVPEHELLVPGEPALLAADDHLPVDQLREHVVRRGPRRRAPEESRDAAAPEPRNF
jgi:hypothetical protein